MQAPNSVSDVQPDRNTAAKINKVFFTSSPLFLRNRAVKLLLLSLVCFYLSLYFCT
jgi:hypothetical protein